ncbi:MAG: cell division protein ZapE [Alphaproteobacteria bacterium]
MTNTPLKRYQQRLDLGDLKPDPVQHKAIEELDRLFTQLVEQPSKAKGGLLRWIRAGSSQTQDVKGVYMHGGVGRGKSMLMDLFYDCLPDTIKKRRVHFHEFMIEVHDYIHSRAQDDSGCGMVDQALPSLAGVIARRSNVLCFDEFHVVDITDAMILGRLFKVLFEHNVTVVATSNWSPDDLYKDGLQRERFLPFISLLKTKVDVVHLDSPHDYRAQTLQVEGTYFSPLNSATTKTVEKLFETLTDGAIADEDSFEVKGREIVVSHAVGGVGRFTFAQLCERPHGAEDYLEIARRYHTVFLEGVPKINYDRRNEAKRLMNLIDALYEARTRVIISAAASAEKLYRGHDHAYEFERTVSRLLEMQSDSYP